LKEQRKEEEISRASARSQQQKSAQTKLECPSLKLKTTPGALKEPHTLTT